MQVNRNVARYALIAIGVMFFAAAIPALLAMNVPPEAAGALMLANGPVALPEIKSILDAIMKGFEDFKKSNDERLAKIEKGESTSDIKAQMAKIEKEIADAMDLKKQVDMLEAKSNLAGLIAGGGTGESDPDKAAYRKNFYSRFVRKGADDSALREMEKKAWNITTPADGGYTVPEQLDREIEKMLRDISPMRSVARVVTVSTSDYTKLVNKNGTSSGWVGETDARPGTNTATWAPVTPFMGEIYANPQITQQMLDDSFLDVESEIAEQLLEEFAVAEGSAFISGDGVKKPKGFLAYASAATGDAARAFGTLEYVPTGVSGDFAANNKADILYDCMAKLKAGYRAGSSWMMAKAVLFEIMKLKDTTGQYLWQPRLTDNGLDLSLLGHPVAEAEDMPAKAANSLSIAFGNFRRGYYIVDRIGTRMLRDPYTNKPYVGFYTTKRVGGMLVNSEAIKLIKFSAA